MVDKVKLKWIKISTDNVFKISQADVVPSDEGTLYISGDTPAGELSFGIADFENNFVAFPNGTFNISKTLKHGYGVVILCKSVGVAAAGKTIYVAYAGRN